jgi:iron complex outermembrane receptor protein
MKHFLIAALIFAPTSQLFAQEALPDIIVTARKKKESLQDIPISAVGINAEELELIGAESVRDVVDLIPNVSIIGSSSGRYITPYIRGQGNQDVQLPEEISVSFYLDEVPLPRYAFDNELIDIENIEVMRGPQGTLFGKNTQAGAINITTKAPNVADGHRVTVGTGNQGQYQALGVTNFSLYDEKMTNRLAIKYKERDGWIQDTIQNKKLGDMRVFALGNTLSFAPSNDLNFTFKLAAQDEEGTDPMIIERGTDGYPKTGQDILPAYDDDLYTSSLKITKDFGQTVLTTIAAFSYHDFQVRYDEADLYIAGPYLISVLGSATAAQFINNPDVLFRDVREYERQYFGEIRLHNKDEDLSWTTGFNYSKNNYRLISFVNTFSPTQKIIKQNIQLISTGISLFGEATKKLPSKFSLTAGARLIKDEKEFNSLHSSTDIAFYEQHSQKDYHNFAGKLALSHKTTESLNTYASLSRGYQSGGYPSYQFNNYRAISQDQTPYGESTTMAYELGFKSEWMNKRLRINSALFYNDIKDKQVRIRDAATNLSTYQNIDTTAYGAEIESQLRFAKDWDYGLNIGYTSSKFAEDLYSAGTLTSSKGARAANIPYWSGSTFLQYSRYLLGLNAQGYIRSTYKYVGSRYGDNNNLTRMGTYGLLDIRFGVDHERYGVSAFVSNAFDKIYESQAYYYSSLSTEVSSPGLPRLFGAQATVRF